MYLNRFPDINESWRFKVDKKHSEVHGPGTFCGAQKQKKVGGPITFAAYGIFMMMMVMIYQRALESWQLSLPHDPKIKKEERLSRISWMIVYQNDKTHTRLSYKDGDDAMKMSIAL